MHLYPDIDVRYTETRVYYGAGALLTVQEQPNNTRENEIFKTALEGVQRWGAERRGAQVCLGINFILLKGERGRFLRGVNANLQLVVNLPNAIRVYCCWIFPFFGNKICT